MDKQESVRRRAMVTRNKHVETKAGTIRLVYSVEGNQLLSVYLNEEQVSLPSATFLQASHQVVRTVLTLKKAG